jgi:Phage tail assembly chaperone protein
MTTLREQQTGKTITSIEFLNMFPNTSFPAVIPENTYNMFGFDIVFEGPQVTPTTPYNFSQASGLEFLNGKWFTKFIQGPIFTDTPEQTAAEQEAAYKASMDATQASGVRDSRAQMLKDSDWTQVADAPVDTAVWATYRKELRDISTQVGFPWTIVWPVKPE